MFISEAMAQAADAAAATSQGTLTGTLIQLGLIFVILCYFNPSAAEADERT